MNNSLVETARSNRIAAIEYLRIKKQVKQSEGQMICLNTIRDQRETKPIFRTARVQRFEERLAA